MPTPAPTSPPSATGLKCGTFPGAGVQTLFTAADVTPTLNLNDGDPLVLGLRFTTTVAGDITAFRFYKSASEVGGVHSGRVYLSSSGALLGTTGPFDPSTCTGWRWVSVPLLTPVRTSPGVEYTVAVDMVDNYGKTEGTMASGRVSGYLRAVAGGSVYGLDSGVIPRDVFETSDQANYWVDGEWPSTEVCA